jgi:hypothetical protein
MARPLNQEPEVEDVNDSNAYPKITILAMAIIVEDSESSCSDLEDEYPLLNHLNNPKL